MKEFLQKRWVRIVGLIPMSIYSYLAIMSVYIVATETIFRPIHKVFSMTDMIGWIGYLFFLSIIGCSGILAIMTAYYMKGVFKILYIAGAMAIISSVTYLPLSFIFGGDYELYPEVPNEEFLHGKWFNENTILELNPDNTFSIIYDNRSIIGGDSTNYEGTWEYGKLNKIYFDGLNPDWRNPWEVTWGNGYYFITYSIPDNFDAWTGDLGLMREQEWLDTH